MNPRSMLIAAIAVAFVSAAELADAKEIPFQTPAQLKSTCEAGGGSYQAPNQNGVYSCMLPGAATVVCGGVGDHAKTCNNNGPGRTLGAGTIRVTPGGSWSAGTYPARPGLVPRPAGLFQVQ